MKKNLIFFSPDGQGLTSTSAEHIANLAKEMVRSLETTLNELTFYSTSVSIIGSNEKEVLSVGASAEDLSNVKNNLNKIAKAHSLIAWLREAIKAKELLLSEIKDMSEEEYCKETGEEFLPYPQRKESLTEEEYLSSLSRNERNRYFELQTFASVLGKAVHPDGALAKARESLTSCLQTPREIAGEGRDALIYSYTPSVDASMVEEIYFEVQKQYREAQAKLNGLKAECYRAVHDSEIKNKTEYSEEWTRVGNHNNEVKARMSLYIKQRAKEVGAYKIVIPESLKGIYEEVNRLGK